MRFRTPELLLGCFLTVAVFSVGMLFSSQYPRQLVQSKAAEKTETSGSQKAEPTAFWEGIATDPVAAFTLCLVLVGLAQAGLFYVQLRLIRFSLDDAKTAANAAADAANAASRQAHVAEQSLAKIERPYVFISNIGVLRVEDEDDVEGGYTILRVSFAVANYGKIPAIIERAAISLSVSIEPLSPATLDFNHSLTFSPILASGEIRSDLEQGLVWPGDIACDEGGWRLPVLKKESVWFRAVVSYRGPFSSGHETGLCLRYDERTSRFFEAFSTDEYNYQK